MNTTTTVRALALPLVALRARDVADLASSKRQDATGKPHDLVDDFMEQVIGRVGLLALVRDGELTAHERIALIHRRQRDGRPTPTRQRAGVSLAHGSASGPSVVTHDQSEKLTEGDAGLQIVTEVGSADHLVTVAAAHLLLAQVPLPHQIAHDLLHRPLSDPDRIRDITHPGVRVQCQRDQDVPMIGQEHPLSLAHRKHTTRVQVRRSPSRPSPDMCTIGAARSDVSRCRPLWPGPLFPTPASLDGVIEGGAAGRELVPDPAERRSSHEQR
jgi:hypothetical protein